LWYTKNVGNNRCKLWAVAGQQRIQESPSRFLPVDVPYLCGLLPATDRNRGGDFFMSTSKLQRYTGEQLRKRFGKYGLVENTRPAWLVSSKGERLELDFFIDKLSVAVEVQGVRSTRVWMVGENWRNDGLVTGALHASVDGWNDLCGCSKSMVGGSVVSVCRLNY